MNATANVTDGLRRTRQLLEQELERSSLSTQMLGKAIEVDSSQVDIDKDLFNAQNNHLKL